MRLPLATLVLSAGLALASAAPVLAQAVTQDRYGPPPAGAPGGLTGSGPYSGQMLNWAAKRDGATTGQLAAHARPEPLALARQFIPQTAHQAAPEQTPMTAIGPARPPALELMGGPPPASLPTSIYGSRPPQPQAPVRQLAQAPQMISPAPASAPAPGARSGRAHFYSLHRAYGMTPDAIPPPPVGNNFILVGPPSAPGGMGDDEDPALGLDRQF